MKFHCASCGKKVEFAECVPGSLMQCPNCEAEIMIPQLNKSSQSRSSDGDADPSGRANPEVSWGRKCRRVLLFSALGFFVVSAAGAIFSVLTFSFGDVQARILLTTLSLGAYSLTGLCCAVVADQRRYATFSKFGIAASIVGATFAVLTNWEIVTGWEILIKGRISFLLIAIAFGHTALLLMINISNAGVWLLRNVTIVFIALVTILLLYSTLYPNVITYTWTAIGVFGVLNVLGTFATPMLHFALRETVTS